TGNHVEIVDGSIESDVGMLKYCLSTPDSLEGMDEDKFKSSNDLKDLSPEEKNVYLKARELGECTLEDLAFELKKAVYDINGLVTILEIKGYFRTSLGKITLAK
ncbi:MAG: hypothetical protein MJ145_04915, partial [Clostridia bacterium]|nr:hypothetical protein [Clostridia bacterium]